MEFRIPEGQVDKQFWKENGISRILAVDKEAEDSKDIQVLMEDTDVLVDSAFSVEEAVQMLQNAEGEKENYQMILVDWDTIDVDASLAITKIREITSDIVPVLFMTDDDADGIEDVLQNENMAVLQKPFFVAAFKEKIAEMQAGQNGDVVSEAADGENLEGLHFLAAEDNEINAEILSEILSMEGASCVIAENGQLVLEKFINSVEGEFDAILMDVQMPVMNGYEATRAIRALKRKDAGEIPIIAMTANAFAEDEKEALNAGMNVHLAKPIDIELLKKVIKEYTRKNVSEEGNSL